MVAIILKVLIIIAIFIWATLMFILANIDRLFEEDDIMNKNIIEVTPNKDGKIFITLYGTRYEIVVKEPKKQVKAEKEETK